ncbi:MAG: sulfurtransferase TusA family protein [Alphaproteobacteria bacterium]
MIKADYLLDITGDRCPMTFVKTRLMLDKMQVGERLEVRLKGAEPLSNVPRSAKELGHIVSAPENLEDDVHFLVIEKT